MRGLAWKIRGALLLVLSTAGIAGSVALGSSDGSIYPWLIIWVPLALVVIVADVFLERIVLVRLNSLRALIAAIYSDGDLTRRAVVEGKDELAEVAAEFNRLIGSFATIIGKVLFNSLEVGKSSKQLIDRANRVVGGSNRQRDAALATAKEMAELTGTLAQVSSHAGETVSISESSSNLSSEGMKAANRASEQMEQIAESVNESARVVRALGERSAAISGIVQTIREIADQTNLLALNAAIEAARAGEQGRGFAVVADEVRKLAERTSLATTQIGGMIAAVQSEIQCAIASIEAGSGQARSGAELARTVADSLERINRGTRDTMEKIDSIAAAVAQQSRSGENIAEHMHTIEEMAEANHGVAEESLRATDQVELLAANLGEIGGVFRLGPAGEQAIATHVRMLQIVQQAALAAGAVFEQGIQMGKIGIDDLFDERYQSIANTWPQKYHTRFDGFADQALVPLQERLLEEHDWLIYAICTDRKSYVPTHNRRFSQPLTGNRDVDLVNNRTKRIFDDPVGKRCGAHQRPFLLQTYRRDTGEILHDISSPIYVQGRHWGGFRIGYKTAV